MLGGSSGKVFFSFSGMVTFCGYCGRVADDRVVPDLVAVERCIDTMIKLDGSGGTRRR
jgi:hypothetical protein